MTGVGRETQGPTLYALLMDNATQGPLQLLTDELCGYLAAAGRDIAQALVEHLRQAYAEGVRDGFQQGLVAAAEVSR